ncbi:MAG: XdhC family aldehyde oxidoreductase maturation factor [Syntrophobacter sp.]
MNIFSGIVNLLESGESFVLATVLMRAGSAPRSTGARMIVRSDGSIRGTVGGGIVEAQVRRMSEEVFADRCATVKEFNLTANDAGQMGMICGGNVRILLQFMDASVRTHRDLYEEIFFSSAVNRRAWLVTRAPSKDGSSPILPQWLLRADGSVVGADEHLLPDGKRFLQSLFGERHGYLHFEGSRYYIEALFNRGTAFIFGAGHVGQALARMTPLVDFKTVVLDDREEFASRERMASADEVVVLRTFEDALAGFALDEDSYIVIVTRGHAHDKTVLSQSLRTKAGYIGMIGSRRKRDIIYQALAETGEFGEDAFARVHSPVGLAIGAETPEEIAVSILAEMIQVRAEKNR